MDNDSIRKLADDIFREKVLRARKLTFEERFKAGVDLFDEMVEISLAGIRQQHPDANEEEVRRIFSERMRIVRRLNDGNIYRIVEEET
jgi:hypothetical protein